MNATPTNPYVGPRTFLQREGHLFFGRDREARDLLSLVNSEKLVLFYAQSGAGKSSLINTRLIPGLEAKNYEVLRVARVGGEDMPGIQIENIYIFNLLRSLTQRSVEPAILAHLHLSEFLGGLKLRQIEEENEFFYEPVLTDVQEKTNRRRVLIIDQFEEVFSTHPEAWSKREDFFDQLAQAMESNSFLWVVLVMREDYIAALDPYAPLMPGGLRTRYYMQRLGREAAIEAVRKPVEELRPYEAGVAEQLVEDLSSIKVQRSDGSQDIQPGQYVEPVQLQVVCYGLWQNLPTEGNRITEQDVEQVGDVDEALAKYYAGRVAEVAHSKRVKERVIREWIEKQLIAPGGIRGMVLRDPGRKTGALADDVIQALQSDLVRAENRGGSIWYELTHDRLVGPILANNKKWFDENLSPLQRQANLWHDQDRNDSWLLRDQALTEVEKWAAANPDEVTERETEFLEACRENQVQIEREQTQLEREQAQLKTSTRRMRTFLTIVTFLAILAGLTAAWAFWASTEANQARNEAQLANTQSANLLASSRTAEAVVVVAAAVANTAQVKAESSANQALAGSLAAQADSLKNSDYPLALLLSVEAYKRDPKNPQTWTTLFQLLQFTPYKQQLGFEGPVSSVAVSPDGKLIAVAAKEKIFLFDAELNSTDEISDSTGIVYSLVFHQYDNGLVLAAGGCVTAGCTENEGLLTIWTITGAQATLVKQEQAHRALVKSLAFSPDGRLLATGSYDKTILLWGISEVQIPKRLGEPLVGHFSFVNSLAFSPDGKTLISAGDDRNILVWDVSNPEKAFSPRNIQRAHHAPIEMIAFSPDGSRLASASDDNSILLWDWDVKSRTLKRGLQLKGHTGYVRSITFQQNEDQVLLASAGFDQKILLWNVNTGEQLGSPLDVHSDAVNSVAFGTRSLEGKEQAYLISGSSDRTLILWDLSTRRPLSFTSESTSERVEQALDSNGLYTAVSTGQLVDVKNASEELFLRLSNFDWPVRYVEFEGSNLITQYEDQFETSWRTSWKLDPQEWVRLACEAVGRNLTDQEWEQFLPSQPYEKTCKGNP